MTLLVDTYTALRLNNALWRADDACKASSDNIIINIMRILDLYRNNLKI